MILSRQPTPAGFIVYPETDGQPMSENTRQFRWIVTLAGNLMALFRDRPDVFVCGNQNWYPVEGRPDICAAPDVYAVFGRPKGERGSYKQWEEGGVPMTVVFEVLSPGNTLAEMIDKHRFYEEYGVEEYYHYDPESNRLDAYARRGSALTRVRELGGFVSPRLGIRFDLSGLELVVRYPDGRPFLTFEQLDDAQARTQERAERAERLAARLAELTRKLLRQEATPDELAELERLASPPPPAS